MSYLLDTNVVSALRRLDRFPSLSAWIARNATAVHFTSVVTIGEIERGIASKRRKDPHQAAILRSWLDVILAKDAEFILPVTLAIARRWGSLVVQSKGANIADMLLAATALEHDLTLVTGDADDFAGIDGLRVENPLGG